MMQIKLVLRTAKRQSAYVNEELWPLIVCSSMISVEQYLILDSFISAFYLSPRTASKYFFFSELNNVHSPW